MRWVTAKRLFLLFVLVVATLAAMRMTVPEPARITPLEARVRDILAPLHGGLNWVGRQASNLVSLPVSMYRSAERSRLLEQEVARLESQVTRLNEYRMEAERLSRLLDYRDSMAYEYNYVAASVIARDPGNWFGTIVLNRGSRDGIEINMTVLSPEGLVGRVVEVTPGSCVVLLISDPRSGVGSLVQDNRTPGIVEGVAGGSGMVRIIYLPNDAPVEAGQAVITSGFGSVFPKGLPVGEITSVYSEPSGLFKTADIRPYANLSRLEEVLIVTYLFNGDSS